MDFPITLSSQQQTIAIMRVENGWLVRTETWISNMGHETPLMVAETPDALVEIVRTWAAGQAEKPAAGRFD